MADTALLVTAKHIADLRQSSDITARISDARFMLIATLPAEETRSSAIATSLVANGLATLAPLTEDMKRDIRVWIFEWTPAKLTAAMVVHKMDELANTPLPPSDSRRIHRVILK